jgi:hypothetical protein
MAAASEGKDPALQAGIAKVQSKTKELALNRLELALESITPDKLEKGKLRELSAVARDMHAIASDQESGKVGTNVIIYNTVQRPLSDYEVVESKPDEKSPQLPH